MENPNRNFKSQTCEDFIEVLASKAAVPGGGGASALAGAIGIALGNMVVSLTVGQKTYADVEEEIIECKKQADEIAKEFLELMDKYLPKYFLHVHVLAIYGSGFKRKDVYGTTRVINGYEFYVIEYPGEPVVPAEKTEDTNA